MTRRKKQAPQQKRQQITDSSGWTHIIKGQKSSTSSIEQLQPNQMHDSLSLEDYAGIFSSKYTPLWQESECFRSLARILEQRILTTETIELEKCICLGLGSLTAGNATSSYQLAALISIIDMLGTKHQIQEVVFQDPVFNNMDKSFLTSLGYTVLEDPEAFSRIDEKTFVFAPHLEVAQAATSLEERNPAVYVGNDLNNYVNGLYRRHAEDMKPGSCDIFQQYIDCTDSTAMPEFDRTTWTHETNIYWLKPATSAASSADIRVS